MRWFWRCFSIFWRK